VPWGLLSSAHPCPSGLDSLYMWTRLRIQERLSGDIKQKCRYWCQPTFSLQALGMLGERRSLGRVEKLCTLALSKFCSCSPLSRLVLSCLVLSCLVLYHSSKTWSPSIMAVPPGYARHGDTADCNSRKRGGYKGWRFTQTSEAGMHVRRRPLHGGAKYQRGGVSVPVLA
jgi:hypothetical protein